MEEILPLKFYKIGHWKITFVGEYDSVSKHVHTFEILLAINVSWFENKSDWTCKNFSGKNTSSKLLNRNRWINKKNS